MTVRQIAYLFAAWVMVLTGLHLWLNFDWTAFLNEYRPEQERKLNVGYLPVT